MTQTSYITRLRGSIRRNLEQARLFGPGFLLRHYVQRRSAYRVMLKGYGPISFRRDQNDASTFAHIFVEGEYDIGKWAAPAKRVQDRYQTILDEGKVPVIIDAGANVGAAALWFGARYPAAAIVSIEPEPGNAKILLENVAGRGLHLVLEAAIASTPGKIGIANGVTGDGVMTSRDDDGAITAITIQDALAAVPNGAPFVTKIDIEGFESDLFASNLGWIDEMVMVLIEPHDWMLPGQFSSLTFQQAMGARRFEMFINGENLIYVAA